MFPNPQSMPHLQNYFVHVCGLLMKEKDAMILYTSEPIIMYHPFYQEYYTFASL